MKVSFRWLGEVAPELGATQEELTELLAARGAPVEELLDLGAGLQDIVVARVEHVEPHPGADRLSLCRVTTGGDSLQVVCGAPNVAAGRMYPFAPVGALLPGGTKIGAVTIRGKRSEGMLCSERELGLGGDHAGILELEEEVAVGSTLVEALGLDDLRMEIEVTANRGDLLSHLGIAREVAPGGNSGIRPSPIPGGEEISLELRTDTDEVESEGVRVRIQDPDLCPRYLGAVLRGVEIKPSPRWLKRRIRAVGGRPVNNVVDATNYVLLETGQPLHAFDLALLAGSTIEVRRSREGERITTLDGVERALAPGMLAICDAQTPVAIAGVMGGEDPEVSSATGSVLIECALFDPKSVRGTRRALGMSTEASHRFERGVDPEGLVPAMERVIEIILATAGGAPDPGILDVAPRPWRRNVVRLRPQRVRHLLGVSFGGDDIREILEPLGFEIIAEDDEGLEVSIPGYRSYDVTREVDLIEEIARRHGYDEFPDELGSYRPGTVPDHPLFEMEDDLRRSLAGRGYFEAHTPAFASPDEGEVPIRNPISSEESVLRWSLLPGLLRGVEHNFARGARDIRLFEMGTVFRRREGKAAPREDSHLAVVATGRRHPPHWSGPSEAVDVWDLKSLLEELGEGLFGEDFRLEEGEAEISMPGSAWIDPATAMVGRAREVVAYGGIVREDRVDGPVWAGEIAAMEVRLPRRGPQRSGVAYRSIPSFPGVARDMALLIPGHLSVRSVMAVIRTSGGPLLADVEIFDLYRGRRIPRGTRSVGFRLRFESPERTLTDDYVDDLVAALSHRLAEEIGVQTRGG